MFSQAIAKVRQVLQSNLQCIQQKVRQLVSNRKELTLFLRRRA